MLKFTRHYYAMNTITCGLSAVLMFCILQQDAHAQPAKQYSEYTEHHFRSLRYGWFKPEGHDIEEKYPLIVYLRGSTDTVSRDMLWYRSEVQHQHPSFVLTPKCEDPDQGWGNTWHAAHTPAMQKTLALVDSLVKVYPIDVNRLYIFGISMGGFGVFSVLAKERGKFAAAYAVCGGSDVNAAAQLLQTPLWIFHGAVDDVVPARLSRDVYKEMIRLGGTKVKYTEYPGVKHNSWENVAQEKSLSAWLFSQRLGAIK